LSFPTTGTAFSANDFKEASLPFYSPLLIVTNFKHYEITTIKNTKSLSAPDSISKFLK